METKDLARSACRIFGHSWDKPKYHAGHEPYAGKLTITRIRSCKRCGKVEEVQR